MNIRPSTAERLYFVLASFGRLGLAWVERDPPDCTWANTVAALAAREWNQPVRVIEANLTAGTSADVTDKAFAAAALVREGVRLDCIDTVGAAA